MRRVEDTLLIRKKVRTLWTAGSSLRNWGEFLARFSGSRKPFVFEVIEGPKDPPAIGTVIAVQTPGGRRVMECKVTRWDPPRALEFTSSHPGWMTGTNANYRMNFFELDDEMTNVTVEFVAMFTNRFVEIFSLLMPVGLLYRRRLRDILTHLRDLA